MYYLDLLLNLKLMYFYHIYWQEIFIFWKKKSRKSAYMNNAKCISEKYIIYITQQLSIDITGQKQK